MNELDKLSPGADDLNLEVAAETAAMSTAATSATGNAECDNTCVETTSPSADIAEAADAAEADECAVESSPAEDLAKVADEITEKPEENVVSEKNYHSMSKQEMIEALREIVSSGDMEAHKEVAAVKQAFYSLLNKEAMNAAKAFVEEGNPADQFSAPVDEDEVKIKALLAEFREKRSAYLEEKEEERKKNLEEKSRIVAELKAIAEDIDNINLHFPKFQQLQQDFKAVGEVPAGSENEIWRSYQSSEEQFYDRLKMNKELRDLDFKKNLEIKQLLVEKARQLTTLPDPIEAFRKLQDLHDQWREIGPVAKEVREDIWNEFKEASAMINKRHQDYFQSRKAEETDNEIAKTALCEKVEAVDLAALKTFAEWDAKTKEILEIQKAYKEIGFAPRKSNGVLFSRFRKACDAFFTTKAEYFKKTKDEFRDNLAKKEALCEKAEALLPRAEEKEAYDELQELQKEWRTVGVVRRKQGDEVWKRFCAAIDAFHDARKKHFGAQRSAENENLKAKQAIIARLKAISTDAERKDVIESIRQLQNEWQQTGFVPFKH